MYHAACKEALAAKQKVLSISDSTPPNAVDLVSPNVCCFNDRQWNLNNGMGEEKRIQEAHLIEEIALKIVEWEKAKAKAANEAAQKRERNL
jgi:hypothetical protein